MEKSAMTARLSRFAKHCAMALVVAFGVSSCSETINEGNFAIKSEETALDFLTSNPQFSKIKAIYDRVRLGRTEDASSLSSVLSARGNYTVFLPTNEAVQHHLDSLGVATLDELSAEELDAMAKSCIIDNGDNTAYETPDFPTSGAFPVSCLSDRLLSCNMDDNADFIINGTSRVIKGDIGRHPTDRKKMAVTEKNSRNAVTHWEVIARYRGHTHLRCRLETGRTHQIRVHLAWRSHPIVGDSVYGHKKPELGLNSQCLHAAALDFIHPRTGKPVHVECELPDYFRQALSKLEPL